MPIKAILILPIAIGLTMAPACMDYFHRFVAVFPSPKTAQVIFVMDYKESAAPATPLTATAALCAHLQRVRPPFRRPQILSILLAEFVLI